MKEWLSVRWNHFKSAGKTWWILAPALWGLFWAVNDSIEKWGNSSPLKVWWEVHTTHAPSHWQTWLDVFLILFALGLVDGGYRRSKEMSDEYEGRQKGIKDESERKLKAAIDDHTKSKAHFEGKIKELEQKIKEIEDKSKPKLKGAITQSTSWTAVDGLIELLFPVSIVNEGAPSAAGGWHMHITSPTLGEQTIQFTRIGVMNIDAENLGIQGKLEDKDGIYETAIPPIQTGAFVSGWLRFRIPGGQKVKDEITNGQARMIIHFYDVKGIQYEIQYQSNPVKANMVYVPGTVNFNFVQKKKELEP